MSKELNVNVNATQAHSLLDAFEKLTTNRSHNRGTIRVGKSGTGGISSLECVNHHFWPWNHNSTKISKDMVVNLREALHQVVGEELAPQFEVMLKNADPTKRNELGKKIEAVLDAFAKAINKGEEEGKCEALSRAEISKFVGNVKLIRKMTSVDALLQVSDRDLALMAARKSVSDDVLGITHTGDGSYKAKEASAKAFGQAKALIGSPLLSDKAVLELGQAVFDRIFPKVGILRRCSDDLASLSARCPMEKDARTFEKAEALSSAVGLIFDNDDYDEWLDDESLKTGRVFDRDLGERARKCRKTFLESERNPEDVEAFFNGMTDILKEQKKSPRKELEEIRETLENAGIANLGIDELGHLVAGTKADVIKLLDAFSTEGGGEAGVGGGFDGETRAKYLGDFVRDLQAKLGTMAPRNGDVRGSGEVPEPAGTLSRDEVEFRRGIDSRLNRIYLTSTELKSLLATAGERIMKVIVPDVDDRIRAEADDETRRNLLAEVNGKLRQRYPALAFEDDGKVGVRLAAVGGQSPQAVLNDVKAVFRDFATGDFLFAEFGGRGLGHDDAIAFVGAFVHDVSGDRPRYADELRTDYASGRELHLEDSPDYTVDGRFDLKRLEADIRKDCRGKHFRHAFAYAIDRFTKKFEKIDTTSDPNAFSDYVESLKALKVMFNYGTDVERNAKALCDKVITNIESRQEVETRNEWGEKENVRWRVTSDSLENEVKGVLRLVRDLYGKNVTLP